MRRLDSAYEAIDVEAVGVLAGIADDTVTRAIVRPVQFHDVWSRSGACSPERRLALAVVEEALNDVALYSTSTRPLGARLCRDAWEWIAADDHESPFSFVNLCDELGLPIDALRRQALGWMRPPSSVSRGTPAARKSAIRPAREAGVTRSAS
jgi:hypothetical protein